jgi:ubiquitin C-terminal hydrolase
VKEEEEKKEAIKVTIDLLKGRAVRQTLLQRTGPVVALHLKRFDYGMQKLTTELIYPATLSFASYFAEMDPNPVNEEYTLLGISCHDGGLGGGHYTAVVRYNGEVFILYISPLF